MEHGRGVALDVSLGHQYTSTRWGCKERIMEDKDMWLLRCTERRELSGGVHSRDFTGGVSSFACAWEW